MFSITRAQIEGRRLGAQLAHRQCIDDRNGQARRAQYWPAMPRALGKILLCNRLRTIDGTVAAASGWDEPMQIMGVRSAQHQSYERLLLMANAPGLLLPLKQSMNTELLDKLHNRALTRERRDLPSGKRTRPPHSVLPRQFDEYIWIPRTSAVKPFEVSELQGLPNTYPFGV